MTGDPDEFQRLVKYSKLSVERIMYFPNADENLVKGISRGILFQMAFWSIYSVQAFAKLTEVISRLDPDGKIELVVVDIDGSERLSAVSEFLRGVRGIGEQHGCETA